MVAKSENIDVDKIIAKLLACTNGKEAKLTENEIRALCYEAREIFM
jgi:hypothetical protein